MGTQASKEAQYAEAIENQLRRKRKAGDPIPELATYQLLEDRVLVELLPAENRTASGLITSVMSADIPGMGVVVLVGPGKLDEGGKHIPPAVWRGDVVNFGRHAGTKVQIGGVDLVMLREADIYGKWGKHAAE